MIQQSTHAYIENVHANATAFRRAAHCVVKLFNGHKDGSLSNQLGQHVSFWSEQRLQQQLGIHGIEGRMAEIRTKVIEDASAVVAAEVYAAYHDGIEAEDVGRRVEQKLREQAAAPLSHPDQERIWISHIYRLGQLSLQLGADERSASFNGNAPSREALVELYADCATMVLQFWAEIEQLAAALMDSNESAGDPVLPLVPLIFNKRFSQDAGDSSNAQHSA